MSKLNQEDNRWNRKRPHKSEPCHLSGQNEVLQLKMKPSTTQILTELKPYHSKLSKAQNIQTVPEISTFASTSVHHSTMKF
ncbi:hypothetical protein M8J75_009157 [Diaphorina citri]|nr:hypothetical protein M8J75_009157 [Diaphorina citri]